MAVTSTIEYCTDSDVYQVYPGINAIDSKVRLYGGWVSVSGNLYYMHNSGYVENLFKDCEDLGAETSGTLSSGQWVYTEASDRIEFNLTSTNVATLNASVWEAGLDFQTLLQTNRRNASRYLESRIDFRVAKEISKDREGNYPYIVIRCTALITALLLLKAQDPNTTVIEVFEEEINEIIDGINSGKITLTHQVTMDSSEGIIREVGTISGALRPVELRGRANGLSGFDLIKLNITSGAGGVLGTSKYDVTVKDSTKLKNNTVISGEIITGDFQTLAYGLQVRFAGGADSSSATAGDEWEIEVYSGSIKPNVSTIETINLTRGGHGFATRSSRRL